MAEVQYSVCFGSPLKPKVGMEKFESSMSEYGYYLQYHLTSASPKLIRKASEAKDAAVLAGKSLLAVARSNCKEDSKKGSAEMDEEAGPSIPPRKKQTPEEHQAMEAELVKASFNQHNRQTSEKITKLLEDLSGLQESHKKLALDHQKLNEDYHRLAIEYRIFVAEGTTRTLVIMDLLALEVSLMDWFLQQEAAKSEVKECEQLCQMIKDTTFFEFWWFMVNETFYHGNPEFNIHKFWQQKLMDYQPSLALLLARSKEFPVICSPLSRLMAMKAYDWLKMAAQNLMTSFKAENIARSMRNDVLMTSCEAENIARFMTTDIIIDSLGFYISVPRNPRNHTIHLLENLILWPEDQQEKKRKKRSAKPYKSSYRNSEQAKGSWAQQAKSGKRQKDGFPLQINLNVVDKAINFLTEIINGLDMLEGDLKAIRTNIEWFAKALLDHCVHALSEGNSQLLSK